MPDVLDIIFRDLPLDDSERRRVRTLLAEDVELRRAVERWFVMEAEMAASLEEAIPDRRLLALRAMERAGISLDAQESAALDAAREGLDSAGSRLTALDVVEDRIADDIRCFERCWDRARAGADGSRPADRSPHRSDRRAVSRWVWRIPVAAVVLFFVAIVVLLGRRDAAFEYVTTGADETRRIEMADGSTVHLRENSRLGYVPSERQGLLNKRARLEGRALFEITARQAGLVVETATASVTVVGTTFALVAEDDVTDVYLVEGRLTFAPEGSTRDAVSLTPGQHSRVARGERPTGPHLVDLADALDWTGFFIFRSTPLAEIAGRIGDHYGVKVLVSSRLRTEQITGTFDASLAARSILETIAAAADARLEPLADGGFVLQ
jgi:transmembrane sensor